MVIYFLQQRKPPVVPVLQEVSWFLVMYCLAYLLSVWCGWLVTLTFIIIIILRQLIWHRRTLLSCDEKTSFHIKCRCQILHIHWSQHVTNAEISALTGLPPVMDFIRRRCLSVFGHIARLTQGTPAHNALHCHVGLASGRSLGRDWRRRPGRPGQGILQGHGGATRQPKLATRWRRRRRLP